jgi:sugar phosphate isomerase/epimerase
MLAAPSRVFSHCGAINPAFVTNLRKRTKTAMNHLSPLSRRRFLVATGAAAMVTSASSLAATSGAKPAATGTQLDWLSPELNKDFDGTLHTLARFGYQYVELVGDFGRSPRQLLNSFNAAGLRCESRLFDLQPGKDGLDADLARQIDFAHALGLKYLVGMMPAPMGVKRYSAEVNKLTLDDFKRIAELFNTIGAQTKKSGLQFAYHNFNYEFRSIDGVMGYDELLRLTDPELVKMELDCGWMKAGGQEPAKYLREHPGRFPLLHVKDVKDHDSNTVFRLEPVEVGYGIMDWAKVFAAARASGVRIGYVEYEPLPPLARPLLESAKLCIDYMRTV